MSTTKAHHDPTTAENVGHSKLIPETKVHVNSSVRDTWFKLGVIGFFLGPAVDALHNQELLEYAIFPVEVGTSIAVAKSSILVPPLLFVAYLLLGGVFPIVAKNLVGPARILPPPGFAKLSSSQRAVLAVASTAGIIRTSAILAHAQGGGDWGAAPLAALSAMVLVQWLLLDGAAASLALAATAAIMGPIAEIPFTFAGCWEYTQPDYWPLSLLGLGPESGAGWAGLSSLTGPCYFAVTTDAIALGRWLAGDPHASCAQAELRDK